MVIGNLLNIQETVKSGFGARFFPVPGKGGAIRQIRASPGFDLPGKKATKVYITRYIALVGAMNQRARILLVDDEVAVRDLYQLYLERNGYSVVAASGVAEALMHLRQERFAAAVVDIFLGEDNGIDLLKGIIASGVALPVIIISGIGYEAPLFQEAVANGAAGIFTKSRHLSELIEEIRRVIGKDWKESTVSGENS